MSLGHIKCCTPEMAELTECFLISHNKKRRQWKQISYLLKEFCHSSDSYNSILDVSSDLFYFECVTLRVGVGGQIKDPINALMLHQLVRRRQKGSKEKQPAVDSNF